MSKKTEKQSKQDRLKSIIAALPQATPKYAALPDLTNLIDPLTVNDHFMGLNKRLENVVDDVEWGYIYEVFSPPYYAGLDCADLCGDSLTKEQRERNKETGHTNGWCCNATHGSGAKGDHPVYPVSLMGASEYNYLVTFEEAEDLLYEVPDSEGSYVFICAHNPCCPRRIRPFWCRAWPFVPVLDEEGDIIGVYQLFSKETGAGQCQLEWDVCSRIPIDDYTWNDRFIDAWNLVLRLEEAIEFTRNFSVDEMRERLYK